MKPLLIGEANPYGADPYFALYPYPKNASGDRLCRLIMKMTPAQYLRDFDRINLCPTKWSAPVARERAQAILKSDMEDLVLFGAKVSNAFGLPYEPFKFFSNDDGSGPSIAILPHPSGLNRIWNEPDAYDRAHLALGHLL